MQAKKIDLYITNINGILQKNKDVFIETIPMIRCKQLTKKKNVFTIEHTFFLKSKYKDRMPYIVIDETWENDEMVSYSYRLSVPYIQYCLGSSGEGSKAILKDFEFRYELHGDIPDHEPKEHLHVLDNIPPCFSTHKTDFGDFFNIIKRDFVEKDRIVFNY